MTIEIKYERMSEEFEKFHLGDGKVLHHFTGTDRGGPHDHPWSFESQILSGGYIERVYHPGPNNTWSSELIHRRPGDKFKVTSNHIHEIFELPTGECWTIVEAGPYEREVRFWKFDEESVTSRTCHEDNYS